MTAEEKPFFLSQNNALGEVDPKDDLLHPEENSRFKEDSVTETQYFGFCIPDQRIHAMGYLWHHSNLKILTGGVSVWRGIKPNFLYSELNDFRTFMSDSAIANDLHDYRLDNGYGVSIIEPLKRHHLTYSDVTRGSHLDLHYEALLPPVMFGDGNHFEQVMKVTGELILRGQRYDVDCYTIRDRSWGKPRSENIIPMPPMSWLAGTFGPDFSFNCGIFDQARGNPELEPPFVIPDEKTLTGGWLNRGGMLGRIIKASKRVIRSPDRLLPQYMELIARDEWDRELNLRGTMVAANTWQAWGNVNFVICLMRWECDGLVAYGDCQEGIWNDYLYAMLGSRH